MYDARPAWHFGAQIVHALEADGFGLQRVKDAGWQDEDLRRLSLTD